MYSEVVERVVSTIHNKSIHWVSIGGLRYLPQLKPIALKRRPDTNLFLEETIAGEDGKIRYLRNQRVDMFQFLNQKIKSLNPEIYTYLCMETLPVWEKALGRLPDRGF